MSTKTTGDDQEGRPEKKPRTSNTSNSEASPVSEDDEDSKSPYTFQAVFHRVPRLVLEEIFNYLDAPQATRLGRAFPCQWATVLTRNAVRNKGIAFFERPASAECSSKVGTLKDHMDCADDPTRTCREPWSKFSLTHTSDIAHLVFVKSTISLQHNCVMDLSDSFPRLKKLAFVRCDYMGKGDWANLGQFRSSCIESISFTDCSISFYRNHIPLNSKLDYWDNSVMRLICSEACLGYPNGVLRYSITWNLRVQVPFFQVNPQSAEVTVQQKLDRLKLIWPYPDEQLQWLMESLSKLESEALEAVKDADRAWQVRKTQLWVSHLDKLDLTTNATSNDRKLASLDLAFLGRLLVGMHSIESIPNFVFPPFAFPEDFSFRFVETL